MFTYKKFPGGYSFKNFEGKPRGELAEVSIPSCVTVLFDSISGCSAVPAVKQGDKVKAGQVIGICEGPVSYPVLATINGTVEEIKKINYYGRDITAATISGDRTGDWQPAGPKESWKDLPVSQLEHLLHITGAAALGRHGIPTRFKSSPLMPDKAKDIIISGINHEPIYVSPAVLFKDSRRAEDFAEGVEILHTVMPGAKIHIAYEKNDKFVEDNIIGKLGSSEYLSFYPLSSVYPQGSDHMLASSVLGKSLGYGRSAPDEGIVIVDFQTVLQVRDAVAEGKPVIERIIALVGHGWKDNLYIKVRIGTRMKDITEAYLKGNGKFRLVADNFLTEEPIYDLSMPVEIKHISVTAIPENTKRQFLAFTRPGLKKYSYSRTFLSVLSPWTETEYDTNVHGEERPCIFCGFCDEACPVGIIPHLIDKYADRNMVDSRVAELGAFRCIQCGLCSFVCPSKIPVAKHIKEAQAKLDGMGIKSR
jgi:electron transport complex protein RnfC